MIWLARRAGGAQRAWTSAFMCWGGSSQGHCLLVIEVHRSLKCTHMQRFLLLPGAALGSVDVTPTVQLHPSTQHRSSAVTSEFWMYHFKVCAGVGGSVRDDKCVYRNGGLDCSFVAGCGCLSASTMGAKCCPPQCSPDRRSTCARGVTPTTGSSAFTPIGGRRPGGGTPRSTNRCSAQKPGR